MRPVGGGLRGLEAWTDFLKDKEIPIMQASKLILQALAEGGLENVAPKELVRLVVGDPFLAINLLRRAQQHRSHKMERESATPLATIMQVGLNGLMELVEQCQVADGSERGLAECAFQSATASYLARRWAFLAADTSLDEIAMAALLADIGEMMLWNFVPDVPIAVLVRRKSHPGLRSSQAQNMVIGTSFKDISLALATAWDLPPLTAMLIRGEDNFRANIARIASNTARHLRRDPDNPIVRADVAAILECLPAVHLQSVLAPVPISDEFRQYIQDSLEAKQEAA